MTETPPETPAMEPTEPTDPAMPTLPPPEELRRRGLFAYQDGTRDRLVDVFDVQLRIQKQMPNGDMDAFFDLMKAVAPTAPDPDSAADPAVEPAPPSISFAEAMVRLGEIVGVAFDLPPLDLASAQGLSIRERIDLLGDFYSAEEPDPEDPAEDGLEGGPILGAALGTIQPA